MRIVAGTEGGWRTVRVVGADRGQRAALVELGFGPELVRRFPPGTRHFGGIRVEWLGNPARTQEGPWPLAAQTWTIASPFEEIRWHGRVLRVPPVGLCRQIEVHRQRLHRVAAIDDYCTAHGQE